MPTSLQATSHGSFKTLLHRQGIYLAPSQYEAGFTSLAHTEEDIEKTIAAAKEVFAAL